MKKLVNYIDKAKLKSGSDYMTAKELGISKQAISFARSGRGMTAENCTKLAMFLNVEPMEIIAASEITKHPEKAEFWGKWVATICLTTSGLLFSIQSLTAKAMSIVCILC